MCKDKRILQDVRTFWATSETELDEEISKYANRIQMPVKTVSLAIHSFGYGDMRLYATVVFEDTETIEE